MTITSQELASVLAGLRALQLHTPADVGDIATNGGTTRALSDYEIDELCERLNCDMEGADPAAAAAWYRAEVLLAVACAFSVGVLVAVLGVLWLDRPEPDDDMLLMCLHKQATGAALHCQGNYSGAALSQLVI